MISYTACIKACAKAGELDRALALFSAMEHFQVVPDKYTSAGLGLARIRTPEPLLAHDLDTKACRKLKHVKNSVAA